MRGPLQAIARRYNGNVKVVEVPPGPPVMSPLVAEIYGLNYQGQTKAAWQVRRLFENTPDIVDVDDSVELLVKYVVWVDRAKAARLGVSQSSIAEALATVLDGEDVGFLRGENLKYAVLIRLEYTDADMQDGVGVEPDIVMSGDHQKEEITQ